MMLDGSGQLHTGAGYVQIVLPVSQGITLPLPLTVMMGDGALTGAGQTSSLGPLKLGGVLQAYRLDQLASPDLPQLGTMPGDTMLDVIYANLLGPLLALPRSTVMPGCRTADIDIDGDGLEAFCDSNPDDDIKRVDTCIDGDGTVIHDGDNGVAQCTQAMVGGRYRFVDGISAGIQLSASPANIAP
jgi:hypothetical protein